MAGGADLGADAAADTDPVSAAQIRAARAYAATLFGGTDSVSEADAAAEDALGAFRQALSTRAELAADAQGASANATLLALTRLMTAVSVPDRSSPGDRRQAVWASLGHSSHCTCRESAALLATRANSNIQPRESAALDEHLAHCSDCRALADRCVAADDAFRAALAPPPGPGLGGIGALPRMAYALLALLLAAGAGTFALLSGGTTNASHAAVTPIRTQPATTLTPAPATPAKSRRRVVDRPRDHHRASHTRRHAPTSRRVTASPAAAGPASAGTASAGTAGAPAAVNVSATPAGTGATGAGTAAASPSTRSSSAPAAASSAAAAQPSAAQVSGQSSLPAASAPQQGIGSLGTTTTP